jgi:hypothetical protein
MRKVFWFMLGVVTASIGWVLAWYFTSKPALVKSESGDEDDDEDFEDIDVGLSEDEFED